MCRPPIPEFAGTVGRIGVHRLFPNMLVPHLKRPIETCELPHRSRETFAEFGGKTNA
jgi:hypothetical protein